MREPITPRMLVSEALRGALVLASIVIFAEGANAWRFVLEIVR